MAESQRAQTLLRSEQGVNLVRRSIDNLWQTVQKVLCADSDASAATKFQCTRKIWSSMYVSTVRGLYLNVHPTDVHMNSVANTRLVVKIFQRHWDGVGQPASAVMPRHETEFQPTFRSGDQVVWLNSDKTATYTTEELAGHVIELFVEYIQNEIGSSGD
jgi:hypothetical protein